MTIAIANKLSLVSSESLQTQPDHAACEERLAALPSRLRERGLRVTSERMAVLRVLLECGTHPSAEEVLAAVRELQPSMSSSTVYSTLNLLVEMGEAIAIPTEGGNRYDARRPIAHPHLVCARCHEVSDLDTRAPVAHGPLRAALEERGYAYVESSVRVLGLCPRCQEHERRPPPEAGSLPPALSTTVPGANARTGEVTRESH